MKCRISLSTWILVFTGGAGTGVLAIKLLGLVDGLAFLRIKREHLSYWILPISGTSISIVLSMMQSSTQDEMSYSSVHNLLADFDGKIKQKFLIIDLKVVLTNVPSWSILDDELTAEVVDNLEIMESDDADEQIFDKFMGAGVASSGEEKGWVWSREVL